MYISRPSNKTNFLRAADITDPGLVPAAPAGPVKNEIVSIGKSFSRHLMEKGHISMTDYARLEADTLRFGGYRRIDGIQRYHHTPK